jgi:hypothetical protein
MNDWETEKKNPLEKLCGKLGGIGSSTKNLANHLSPQLPFFSLGTPAYLQ